MSTDTQIKSKFQKVLYVAILLTVGTICFLLWELQTAKHSNKVSQQNVAALQAEQENLKNTANEEYVAKTSYAMEIEELKKVNASLANEYKKYKDRVLFLSNNRITVKDSFLIPYYDTVYVSIANDSSVVYNLNWLYDSNKIKLSGQSTLNTKQNEILQHSTSIDNFSMDLDLFVGILKDKNNKYKAFARSENKNVNIKVESNLDPKIFIQKEKKWGLGFYAGTGINMPITGNSEQRTTMGISAGVGVTFDLFRW